MTDANERDGDHRCEAGIDHARLRHERLARCFAAMEEHGIDALVLGREGNVRYVSDARRLWLAGPRPFGPGCVVVRATRAVHLLATSSAGVPDEIVPAAQLYPLTWNPDQLAASLARIAGLAGARTIGVDGWNASAARLLARVAPAARIADGDALLRGARAVKTADEIACIRSAVAVAGAGLDAARAALVPGVSASALRAAFIARVAALGATIPAFDAVGRSGGARTAGRLALRRGARRLRRHTRCARVAPPDVATDVGAGRGVARCAALRARLIAACRAGASADDLLAAYRAAGEPLPAGPIAHGSGLGAEPPLVARDHACDDAWRTAVGAVLAVHAHVSRPDGTTCATQDLVLVTGAGPELLTTAPVALRAT